MELTKEILLEKLNKDFEKIFVSSNLAIEYLEEDKNIFKFLEIFKEDNKLIECLQVKKYLEDEINADYFDFTKDYDLESVQTLMDSNNMIINIYNQLEDIGHFDYMSREFVDNFCETNGSIIACEDYEGDVE